ncbi:MAG: alpha/beta hydrolase [Robiginitomaculum sp.]|nr:alpha/beta hydrolase [Robiginitomaculum sp.]
MTKPGLGARLTAKLMNLERKLAGLKRKTAPLDGLDMVYYDNENVGKPVIVFIHGYTADKSLWHRPAKMLAKDYHIIAPDMAGHGETPYSPDANYSMPSQVAWLAKLLRHLNIDKAHLVGSSMGGFIAAAFAVAHPDMTNSITLLDPAGITSPEPSDIGRVFEEEGRNMFLPKTRAEFFAFLDMVMVKRPYIPKFALNTMADVHISRRDAYAHIFQDFFDKDFLEDQLHKIQAPTLLVWGKQDQILSVSAAPIWQAGIKNCQTVIYDDLGHVPSMEATKRTMGALVAFVGGVA